MQHQVTQNTYSGSYPYQAGQQLCSSYQDNNTSSDITYYPPPLPPGASEEYTFYSSNQGCYPPERSREETADSLDDKRFYPPPLPMATLYPYKQHNNNQEYFALHSGVSPQGNPPPYNGQNSASFMEQRLPANAGSSMGGYFSQSQQALPWMAPVAPIHHCPPGLEYLTELDQILVRQQKEMIEVMTNIDTPNRYICFNNIGQKIYMCLEESDACIRQCCTSERPFTMHIEDQSGREVIRIDRPYKCNYYCDCFNFCTCCFDRATVEAPLGRVAGYVWQIYDCCHARYHVLDGDENTVLQIIGPHDCDCYCTGRDVVFTVLSRDGEHELGTIVRKWRNTLQEYVTKADNFGVTFPKDLDVRIKATLIAAVFLIDFMFFEQNTSQQNRRNH